MEEGFVAVPGGQLYYDAAGNGLAFVLMHEGIADSRMWDDQWDSFSEQYRTVRFDHRGFGKSTDPHGEFSRAEDTVAVMDHLGIERAAILGPSMSGAVAIDLALGYPDRVWALILLATFPHGYDSWSEESQRLDAVEEKALEAGDIERVIELNAHMWIRGPSRTAGDLDPEFLARAMQLLRENTGREGEGPVRWLEPPAVGRLADIRVPTLVMVSDHDFPDMITTSRFLAERIPGARFEVLAGAAHLPNMERREEFNRIVLDFLDSVRP
jgi:3-oxoadipate enol-lactonase